MDARPLEELNRARATARARRARAARATARARRPDIATIVARRAISPEIAGQSPKLRVVERGE